MLHQGFEYMTVCHGLHTQHVSCVVLYWIIMHYIHYLIRWMGVSELAFCPTNKNMSMLNGRGRFD
jgi:hypothetical protein